MNDCRLRKLVKIQLSFSGVIVRLNESDIVQSKRWFW